MKLLKANDRSRISKTTTKKADHHNGGQLKIMILISIIACGTMVIISTKNMNMNMNMNNMNMMMKETNPSSLSSSSSTAQSTDQQEESYYMMMKMKKSNKIYGHIHFPKTGGSNLNGMMAATYDNVCGHKGYSYDAYQFNIRGAKNNITKVGSNEDSISIATKALRRGSWDRGRIYTTIMNEIGYEDCDYISHEIEWTFWPKLIQDLNNELQNLQNNSSNNNNNNNLTLELHVPCREPISHLMSMANHMRRTYVCDKNETNINIIKKSVDNVYIMPIKHSDQRFSNNLFINNNNNIELKCFNPFPMENYINYMSDKLPHRRFQVPTYVERDTNAKHSKSDECIWDTSSEYKNKVIQLLINNHPYMKFCYDCIGSNNQLQFL